MTAFVEGQRPSIPADGRDNRQPTAVVASDERLEQLLNRAGQTISDLPKAYTEEAEREAVDASYVWAGEDGECFITPIDYILHLTDVIDRLEWALDNVTRERDYLLEKYVPNPYETIPEDWRVDDEG
jgi:hypothetical protein